MLAELLRDVLNDHMSLIAVDISTATLDHAEFPDGEVRLQNPLSQIGLKPFQVLDVRLTRKSIRSND